MTNKPTTLCATATESAPERIPAGTAVAQCPTSPRATLVAALLGFFVITLDAVVVNVALPSIGHEFGAGVAGLQWIVDGYTMMFAALLLSAGSLSDRIGARRAFATGLTLFVAASVGCGLAPGLGSLVVVRFLQGSAAAMMMPSSMALIRQAYPDPTRRGHAVAMWAMGGSVAATSGPVLGGLLTMLDWRWIFFINVPVGVATLALLARTTASPHRKVPFDWLGQALAVVAMGALTFGAIEAGAVGIGASKVLVSLGLAVAALIAFGVLQARGAHPMVPPDLFRSRDAVIAMLVGFTFMVGYFGLPFVMSLYLQQRGLSALATGEAFLPMMLTGLVLTPFSGRLVERLGAQMLITTGLASMMVGLTAIAMLPSPMPVWAVSVLMILVGLAGPFVSPPVTAVLLNSVPGHLAGTASGVFNTSRQVGGALAVAVFGALLAQSATSMQGMRVSLWLAAGVSLATAAVTLGLRPAH
jgi:MFS transporter, DHA2 family, methylenomycin A resistance protein